MPTGKGEHAITHKVIEPLAPAFNLQRFSDLAKADKWFRRNCKDLLVRSRYALFSDFVRSPAAALYVQAYLPGGTLAPPRRYVGHNPAGGWAVLGLLGLMTAAVASGWWAYQSGAPDAAGEAHEVLTNALLILIGLRVVAVVATGFKHRENLVRAMWTGRKRALPEQGIRSSHVLTGLVLFAAVTWLGCAFHTGQLPGLTA